MVVAKEAPSVASAEGKGHAGTEGTGQNCIGRSLCLLPCCVAFSFLLGSVSSVWDFDFPDEAIGTPGSKELQ